MLYISDKIFPSLLITLLLPGICAAANADSNAANKKHLKDVPPKLHNQTTEAPKPPEKKINFMGLTITPGGFIAGEGVWRSRNEQSDIASTFGGIPLGNSPLYHMQEFRLSARQSRFSLLVEGSVNPCTLISGYAEADFLGNGTANSNESNSYDLRMRNVYVTLDKLDWGSHLLGGQNWSLATTTTSGITPRKEATPPTIDAQYVVGFVWKRQAQFRVTQNLGSSLWAAVSIENPQTTFGGTACGTVLPGGITNEVCTAPGAQSLPTSTVFSINHTPDVIGKLAFETKIDENMIHLEAFGLYRQLYDRVQYTNNAGNKNFNTTAGGIGGGMIAKVLHGFLDLQANILSGRGIGSYASGQLPDATLSLNGSLAPIPEVIYMVGATLHATPALDFYVFGGEEKERHKYFQVGKTFLGYGAPNANNGGCNIENGTCAGNTSKLSQITLGLWDKFYQGAYGDLRGGLQYSYTRRELFAGNDGKEVPSVGYHTNDQMVFFSLRYYPYI